MTLLMDTIAAGPAGHVQSSWVVATVRDVSGAAFLVGGSAFNPGATPAYVQVFDVAAASVALGETEPVFSMAVPPGRSARIRPPRPIRCAGGMSFAATGGRMDGTSPAGPLVVQLEVGGEAELGETLDPAVFIDDFETGDTLVENRGWAWFDEETVATQTIAGGELRLVSTEGGASGAWIYNENRGNLLHKPVTGDFDARTRSRVRNAAGTGSPAGGVPLEWRFGGGISITDPDDTDHNSLHMMFGGDPDGQDRGEWKTTDGTVSTWASVPLTPPLDYDARVVRVGQVFSLYIRAFDAELGLEDEGYVALGDDDDWTLVQTIDRTDNTTPARATAVPMPATVWLCITGGYAGPQSDLDIQAWFLEVLVTQ